MMAQVQYQTFSESQLLASLAVEALIDEVNLTPKPALVDRRGSGAHNDLTLELMERSAKVYARCLKKWLKQPYIMVRVV